MCPIMETQPGPGHREQGQGTAEQPVPPGVLGCVLGCNVGTEDARVVAVLLLVLHISVSQECCPKLAVLFVSGDTWQHVSLLCTGSVCVDAVPCGGSSWAGYSPGNEAVHCSQPDPGGFVCLAGSP